MANPENRRGRAVDHGSKRNLKKSLYWYMARFVVAGAILGYMIWGSIEIIVVPAFFFLLYVIDDRFGTVAAIAVLMLGILGGGVVLDFF